MKRNFFLLVIIFLMPFVLFSQNKDSLSAKITLDSAIVLNTNALYNELIQLLGKNKFTMKWYQARKNNMVAMAYKEINQSDSAIGIFERNIVFTRKNNLQNELGTALNDEGMVFRSLNKLDKSVDYYYEAIKIREKIKDSIGLAGTYHNIGGVFLLINEDVKAEPYLRKAAAINERKKNWKWLSLNYMKLGEIKEIRDQEDSCFYYKFKALAVAKKMPSPNKNLAYAYHNIGGSYGAFKKFKLCKAYLDSGLQIRRQFNNTYDLIGSLGSIGEYYFEIKEYSEAEKYTKEALGLSKKINNMEFLFQCYEQLYTIKNAEGNFKQALDYFILYRSYQDSATNIETTKKLYEKELKFEFEKKESLAKLEQEKKDLVAQEEKKRQRLLMYAITFSFLFVIIIAIVLYRGYRNKRKANINLSQKNELIEAQKKHVEEQKHIIEEKHREITDSINYAERIQRSFLATKEILDENLSSLGGGAEGGGGYFIFFKPKDVVSGDFYWAASDKTSAADGHKNLFTLAVADSTGHGVPGAIMSLLNVTSLEKAIEHYTNPADILNHTRQTIIERLKKDGSVDGGKDGMDCSLLVFDFENKLLKIAAANNPVWIIRNNELIEIKPDKMPVGKSDKENIPFTLHTIELQEGDTIYTLTDGFPDQFGGPNGKKFMSKKLKELLLSNVNLSIPQQKELLEKTFKNWVGDLEQVDDVCIIGIRV